MLKRLERRIGWLAIPHLPIYLVIGQAVFFIALMTNPGLYEQMVLIGHEVLAGEVWRLISFLFIPPPAHPLFIVFKLILLWLFGRALEEHWGSFRFTLFVLVGYLATVVLAFVQPQAPATNLYLLASILLAFAFLYPDFTIMLFFIIPVKIKWIAALIWVIFGLMFLVGLTGNQWMHSLMVVAAVSNFLLFFGRDLIEVARRRGRRVKQEARAMEERRLAAEPFHRCTVCGRTEQSDPELEFRYCPHCTGSPCYCMDHIFDHEHK